MSTYNDLWLGALRLFGLQGYVGVPVKMFGAKGDGVTDDTTAIQSAINSLANTGGTIYFGTGTYIISGTLNITTAGIRLVGTGRPTTFIKTTSTTLSAISVSASYVEIDSMGVLGPGSVTTSGAAIALVSAQGCKLTNLYIAEMYQGILLNGSTNCLVQFCKIVDIYGTFLIEITGVLGGGCYIINNQFDPQFYGATYSMSSGFGAWTTSHTYSTGAVVSNGGGWFVCSAGGMSASTGSGPPITKFNTPITDGAATWYYVGLTTLAIMNVQANVNYIAFNDCSGPAGAGILVSNSDSNMIVSNTIGQTLGIGIQLGASATNTFVLGNQVSSSFGPNAGNIEDASGSATGSRIIGNYCSGAGQYGIICQSSHFTINDNVVTGAGQINNTSGILVTANVTKFNIVGNNVVPSAGMTGSITVATGTSDYYNIMCNLVEGTAVVDNGSGAHKTLSGNN